MYTYLASPYSNPSRDAMERRYDLVLQATAWMLKNRYWCFSPIVHAHEMAKRFSLPTEYRFWEEFDERMIQSAESFTILCIPGWRKSVGVTAERMFADRIRKPTQFLVYDEESAEPFDLVDEEPEDEV